MNTLNLNIRDIETGPPSEKKQIPEQPELDTTVHANLGKMQATTKSFSHKKSIRRRIGNYQLMEVLGRGSMSVVHRAVDRKTNKEVAIKILTTMADHCRSADWFEREIKVLEKLNHKNICPLIGSGITRGHKYIVMPFIKGESLSKFVERKNALSIKRIVAIIKTIADALQHAHENGVVHRDLKPANIIVQENGDTMVIDFGLAKFSECDRGLSQDGLLIGTPAYMSPEQVLGDRQKVGPLSDIHALGAVMYHLLTCRLPYSGNISRIFAKILEVNPKHPSRYRGRLRPELEEICLKAMSKGPQDRQSSARLFFDEISRFESRVVQTKQGSPEKRVAQEKVRRILGSNPTRTNGSRYRSRRCLPKENTNTLSQFSIFAGSIMVAVTVLGLLFNHVDENTTRSITANSLLSNHAVDQFDEKVPLDSAQLAFIDKTKQRQRRSVTPVHRDQRKSIDRIEFNDQIQLARESVVSLFEAAGSQPTPPDQVFLYTPEFKTYDPAQLAESEFNHRTNGVVALETDNTPIFSAKVGGPE